MSDYPKNVHVGCSGYYYKHWVGRFYPEDCKAPDFFEHYQKSFGTVDLNSTFYHFPTEKQISSWLKRSEEGFIFTLKAPRTMTHRKRLVECLDEILLFFHLVKPVKQHGKLGVVLFQTPPSLRCDLSVLDRFLKDLPEGYSYAFEFRNETFHNRETFDLLERFQADYVSVSDEKGFHFEKVFAPFKYFRLHGNGARYASNYTEDDLKTVAFQIKNAFEQGCEEVYVYFNNDYEAYAPQNAVQLMKLLQN
jgi:uncharacterized protein YecE (DUF72 family)